VSSSVFNFPFVSFTGLGGLAAEIGS
jgi:hypothetical protein